MYKYGLTDESHEFGSYFAIRMNGNVCSEAVYNVVMPTAAAARQMSDILSNGTWAQKIEDDDEYYAPEHRAMNMAVSVMQRISEMNAARSYAYLPIPVSCTGRVIYVVMPAMYGLTRDEIIQIVDIWTGVSDGIPDHVVFGTYENGIYTCDNLWSINTFYRVVTEHNQQGFCTRYTTTITAPNEDWAAIFYQEFEEQAGQYEQDFGRRPESSIEGTSVTLDAVILGNVPMNTVDRLIYRLDIVNNCPFIFNVFS